MACTTPVSGVPKNACVIMNNCPNYLIFILGLNEQGDGKNSFMLRPPNLIFRGLSISCFYVVNSVLYIIPDKDTVVYTFKLSPELAKLSEHVVERSALERASDLLSPKHLPNAVACGTSLLVFNIQIPYFKEEEEYDDDDEDEDVHNFDSDFELFMTESNACLIKLPPLLVKEKSKWKKPWLKSSFEFHPTSESWSCHTNFSGGFTITSYALMDTHTFLVQTDIGKTFSVRIDKPTEGWKLFGDITLFDGVELLSSRTTITQQTTKNKDQ